MLMLVQPCDLEGLMSRLDEELGFYGVILKDLLAAGEEPAARQGEAPPCRLATPWVGSSDAAVDVG